MASESDPLEAVKTLLNDNWNNANTDSVTPTVEVMFEAPKRMDLSGNADYIGIYLVSHTTVPNALGGGAERTVHRVSIDIRTTFVTDSVSTRTHLRKVYNEVRRIIGANLANPDANFSEIMPLGYQDFSDRVKKFGRYVLDAELRIMNLAR